MTLKQKLAIKEITEKHRPVSTVMKELGYSPNTYSKPSNLTNSKAWQETMDKYLPDDLLLLKHMEALEATKWNDFSGEREPDHTIRLKGTELGYKLKKKLGPEIMQQFNTGGDMTLEFTA